MTINQLHDKVNKSKKKCCIKLALIRMFSNVDFHMTLQIAVSWKWFAASLFVDPLTEIRQSCVNARISRLGATNSKRSNSNLIPSVFINQANQWTSWITLQKRKYFVKSFVCYRKLQNVVERITASYINNNGLIAQRNRHDVVLLVCATQILVPVEQYQ